MIEAATSEGQRARVSVLVTDLDNTLWDWVAVWHASFTALIDVLVREGGIPHDQLLDEIREVHRRHRTSEYSLLLDELPSLAALAKHGDITDLRNETIAAYQNAREETLALYPGVIDTLDELQRRGTLVVAYTESMAFYTSQRIRKTELDGRIRYLYSSPDHDFPTGVDAESIRKHPNSHYELTETVHRHVQKGLVKPNADVLRDIMTEVGALQAETIYVGDSIMKDMRMARDAGVADVFASYGQAQNRDEYNLLRRVTHWSQEDVERETALLKGDEIRPTYTLNESYAELLDYFEFVEHGRTRE